MAARKTEQEVLFEDGPDEYPRAVQTIHCKPARPLSLVERKLGHALMKHAVQTPPSPAGDWEVSVASLSRGIGFNSNDLELLRNSLRALVSIRFEWDVLPDKNNGGIEWETSPLFGKMGVGRRIIRFRFYDDEMKARILTPAVWAKIDMQIVRRFKRASSLAIWEHCVRFVNIGRTKEASWREFRDIVLGKESAKNKTYAQYKYFKSKVLLPAIAEINTVTEHAVELVEKRTGNSVDSLFFKISTKPLENQSKYQLSIQELPLVGDLVNLGIDQVKARKLCQTTDHALLQNAIAYTKQRIAKQAMKPVTNVPAYFREALKNRRAPEGHPTPPSSAHQAEEHEQAKQLEIIRESLVQTKNQEAWSLFVELSLDERQAYIDRYNEQCPSAQLHLDAHKAPKAAAKAAFRDWLRKDLWGEPTDTDLLRHVAKTQMQRPAPSP